MVRSSLRGPRTLVLRVRWLFLALSLLIAVILMIGIPTWDVPGWPRGALGFLSLMTMCGWVIYRYVRPAAPILTDALPLAVIVTLGLSAPSPEDAFGIAFALVCYRALFASRRRAPITGVAFYVAFLTPYIIVQPPEDASEWFSALLLFAFFVVLPLIMQALADAAHRHDVAIERERIHTELSTQLLQADSEEEVRAAAVCAAARALGPTATAVFWSAHDQGQRAAGILGRETERAAAPVLGGRFSAIHLEQMSAGEPLLFEGDEARTIAGALGERLTAPQVLAVPLLDDGRLDGVVVVAAEPAAKLAEQREVMRRFANEVVLGLGRVRLTEELHRANLVKDQFLSMVSHELRTPLTVVRGLVETLLAHGDAIAPGDREHFLRLMHQQALRQQRLIDDLLATSQVVAGRLSPVPAEIDVESLVIDVARELGLVEQVTVLPHEGVPRVWADQLHVIQMVSNLLTNASKYGAPPFEIRLRRDGDHVATCVRDHGPGIDAPDPELLFEPFEQALGTDRAVGGVGLGLAIVRRLALANAGSVQLCPEPSSGACFTVCLPVAGAPAV